MSGSVDFNALVAALQGATTPTVDTTSLVNTGQTTNQVLTAILAALRDITVVGGSLTITDTVHSVTGTNLLTVTGATVGGTTPDATLTITTEGVTFTDGSHTVSDATQLSVTGATIGGTAPNATLTVDFPAGGVTFSDGVHTISDATSLVVTGGTVGGSTPNATLSVTAGVTGSGTANVLPKWTGATSLGNSDFSDTLSVSGSATAELQNDAAFGLPTPGLAVQGTAAGAFGVGPTSTGGGAIEVDAFGSSFSGFVLFSAGGTRGAPTFTPSGHIIGLFEAIGYTGSAGFPAMSMTVTAQSNFNGTPLSSIDLVNASSLGIHIGTGGALTVDDGVIAGTGATTATAGAATLNFPSGIVTSEPLSTATTYTLTLTDAFIQPGSVIQLTLSNSAGTNTWPVSITPSTGSAVITIAFASALTGTAVIGFTVQN